jgi:hypothetical protein
MGRSTSSEIITAFLATRCSPRRVTVPRHTRTWSSPSADSSVASPNQEMETAQSSACSTQPLGARCCSIGPGNWSARLSARWGASSSRRAVTERCTAVFVLALPALHGGASRFIWSAICAKYTAAIAPLPVSAHFLELEPVSGLVRWRPSATWWSFAGVNLGSRSP